MDWKQPQKKVNNCSKKIRKGEKGKVQKKKILKNENLEIWISVHARAKMS